MAKVNSTYQELLLVRNDINKQCKLSAAFALFNRTKISDFFGKNAMRLKTAEEFIDRLYQKYVKHDDDGKPVTTEEKDGLVKLEFNSPEDAQKFNDEYNEFTKRNITIEV